MDEPFEMRERLRDCETPLLRRERVPEDRARDLVAALRLVAQRCGDLVEPRAMVAHDLAREAVA